MKICPNCQSEMPDSATFCPVCGSPLGGNAAYGNYDPAGQENPTVSSYGRIVDEERGTSVLRPDSESGTTVLTPDAPAGPGQNAGSMGAGQGFSRDIPQGMKPQWGNPEGAPQGMKPQWGNPEAAPRGMQGNVDPQWGNPQGFPNGMDTEPWASGQGTPLMGPGPQGMPPQGIPPAPPQKNKPEKAPGGKKKKTGLIIGLVTFLVLAAAGVLLFIFLLRPKMIRDKGDKLMEQGKYDEAIAEYEKLSDPDEYVTKCKYKKYVSLLDSGSFDEAKSGFTELGDYEDSPEKCKECDYRKAKSLLDEKKFDDAKLLFEGLDDYSDSSDMAKECDYQRALQLMAEGNYQDAESWFTFLRDYADSAQKLEECRQALKQKRYDEALACYENGDYAAAAAEFLNLGDFQDSLDKAKMSYYALGEECLENQKYTDAIEAFESAENYSDASDRRKEAIYQYVLTEINAGHTGNQEVETYFKELYDANYKDSRQLYEEKHKWKLEFYAVSTSKDDKTSHLTEVNYKETVFFHYRVVSGDNSGTTKIGWRGLWANGTEVEAKETDRYDIKVGDSGWLWFSNADEAAKGPLYIEAYDSNGAVIGSATVTLTD